VLYPIGYGIGKIALKTEAREKPERDNRGITMGRYKKHDAKTETITIRITEEIKSKILDIKAKKRLTTISQVIRLLILKEI